MTIRTHPREERALSAPWLLFTISDQLERLKQEPEWKKDGHDSITLMKTRGLSVVLIALRAGESVREHQGSGPVALQVISGKVAVNFAGESPQVSGGEMVTVDSLVVHRVWAIEESAILLFVGH